MPHDHHPADGAAPPATSSEAPLAPEDGHDRPFVLGVDLDGVLADYEAAFRPVVARRRGVDPDTLGAAHSWELSEWGIPDRDAFTGHLRAAIEQDRIFRSMPIMPGAREALRRLSHDGVHIRIVTHRLVLSGLHAIVLHDTAAWLERHRVPYWDLCFLGRKSDLAVDLLVDDAPHNVASLRAKGRDVLVMSWPYNRHLGPPRADSWEQVEAHVRDLLAARTPRSAAEPA